MTEQEWLNGTSPYAMLNFLQDKASDRKLILFSVACLRRIWHLLMDERSRKVVEITEQLVDNPRSNEFHRALGEAYAAFDAAREADELEDGGGGSTHDAVEAVGGRGHFNAVQVASNAAEAIGYAAAQVIPVKSPDEWSTARTDAWESAERAEHVAQAALLRDIVGNPFRPVTADPRWLEPKVVDLAHTIYDERAFARLPELAQALEEAGCAHAGVLGHCRQSGEHVRGCWGLDLILGKDELMSEAEWLTCTNPQLMWWVLKAKPSRRKQRLFAAACCHRITHLLTDERCQRAVELVELLADGLVMDDEWRDTERAVKKIAWDMSGREIVNEAAAAVAMADCTYDAIIPAEFAAHASGRPHEAAVQASLLRDVTGNPFRPVQFDAIWRTPSVVQLAQIIYEEKVFDRLPTLGRVLEEAGCHDTEILRHCRGSGPHIRGCWVVDLILGETFVPRKPRKLDLTPAEWDTCTDADKMLYCLHRKASSRKLRLFVCACCRHILDRMLDERSRRGIEVAERYADGLASESDLETARKGTAEAWDAEMASAWFRYLAARAAHFACASDAKTFLLARDEARGVVRWSVAVDPTSQVVLEREAAVATEVAAQAGFLRDLFGNPFRPVAFDPSWLTPKVRQLAEGIYKGRAFDKMPDLADALEKAGCQNADTLAHCRGPGPHVRGCWVVDRILEKG